MLLAGVDALMDYAERMTRAVIERIPDGTYEFHDFLDDDGIVLEPIRIQVKVIVRGSGIHFDFTGTAPQRRGAINCVPSSTLAAVYFAVRALTGAAVPNNDGCYRPITVELPGGLHRQPELPRPGRRPGHHVQADRGRAPRRAGQGGPDRIYAASSGIVNVMYVGGFDPEKQARFVGFIGVPMAGGMGLARRRTASTSWRRISTTRSATPSRRARRSCPSASGRSALARLRRRGPVPGRARLRGGGGAPRGDALVTLRQERHKVHPWGLLGGSTAPACRSVLRRADGREEELAAKQVISVRGGDRILLWITGGGGYGSPLDREPRAVLDDVLDGRVSREAAQAVYGVVLEGDRIAAAATRELRAAIRAREGSAQPVSNPGEATTLQAAPG